MLHRVMTLARLLYLHRFGRHEPESKLIAECGELWNDTADSRFANRSHWLGAGPFSDDLWYRLGAETARMFDHAAQWANLTEPLECVVEWGSGGGMNAVHFAPRARKFCGVDISADSLDECARQLAHAGLSNFQPVLIDAAKPRESIGMVDQPCDLFLCMNVIELLPGREYALEILRIAFDMLRPGGLALVDMQYDNGELHKISRRWSYAGNLGRNTSFRIDEFWFGCESIGFEPMFVRLLAHEPSLGDRQRALFAMQKPE